MEGGHRECDSKQWKRRGDIGGRMCDGEGRRGGHSGRVCSGGVVV